MTKKIELTPSKVQKNFFQRIKDVDSKYSEIHIVDLESENSAVFVSLENWKYIKETLILEQSGVLNQVRIREKDGSGFEEVDGIEGVDSR